MATSLNIVNDEAINGIGDERETFLNQLGIDDTEYTITFYEDSDLPYSFDVKIYNDREKMVNAVEQCKNNDKFVVDRVFARNLKDYGVLCGFRLRLKPEYDKYWTK